ncbi:hypothetical protein ACEWPL_004400 [Roseovarius sp. S1116L3]|uniref:hypothetical protein n=1 Tax=Roseovarius roseus TaxID=3342636 RepID=UPI0037268A63
MLDTETYMPVNRNKLVDVATELAARIKTFASSEAVEEEFTVNLGCDAKNNALYNLMDNLIRATHAAEEGLRTALEAVASAVDSIEEADKCQHTLMELTRHPDERMDPPKSTAAF